LADEVFTYDPVGNRLTSHRSSLHRYEVANRLLEDDIFTYAYSALTVHGPTRDCQGQVENQLSRIALPDGRVASYRYDGLGSVT
jgi:hypothetical protein